MNRMILILFMVLIPSAAVHSDCYTEDETANIAQLALDLGNMVGKMEILESTYENGYAEEEMYLNWLNNTNEMINLWNLLIVIKFDNLTLQNKLFVPLCEAKV